MFECVWVWELRFVAEPVSRRVRHLLARKEPAAQLACQSGGLTLMTDGRLSIIPAGGCMRPAETQDLTRMPGAVIGTG